MSDVGVANTPAASHTNTQQWQSFEIRMRHRRAERCVLRAEVALEAGFEEDARAALDEAHRLNAASPDLETLRAAVAERLALTAATVQAEHRRRSGRLAAAALLLTALVGGAAWWSTSEPSHTATAETAEIPTPPATTAAAAPDASPAAPVATSGAPEVTQEGEGRPSADTEVVRADARTEPAAPVERPALRTDTEAARPSPARDAAPARRTPAPADPREPSLPPVAASVAPGLDTPPSVPVAEPRVPIERVSETLPPPTDPKVEAVAPVPPAPPAEEPRVRAVLGRYASAYSQLNADAAQAVWPGVDGRLLSRAFEGLASQRVSLGRCAVEVDGGRASADCSGSITWTPKVGGGTQTEARQWRFELANANGAWQITRADIK